jgi:hypothetical protein
MNLTFDSALAAVLAHSVVLEHSQPLRDDGVDPASIRNDFSPAGQSGGSGQTGSMLAGQSAESANPEWAAFKQKIAGATPMVAPLSFGQYQGPPSMLAGQGAASTNPEWAAFKQKIAGATPMVAPLSFGQYQGPPSTLSRPAATLQSPELDALRTQLLGRRQVSQPPQRWNSLTRRSAIQ